MRQAVLQRKCACGAKTSDGGPCAACAEDDLRVARKATEVGVPALAPPIVHEVLASPGRPLEPATQVAMEGRLGHDFSDVRIHTDATAARSADAVGAEAWTVGRDIAFASGRYAAGAHLSDQLLVHELTHVVQQSGQDHTGSIPVEPLDTDAERTAERVASTRRPIPAAVVSPRLARRPSPSASRRDRMISDFTQAIQNRAYGEAAIILNGFSDEDMRLLLRPFALDQLERLRTEAIDAMPGWANRVVQAVEDVAHARPTPAETQAAGAPDAVASMSATAKLGRAIEYAGEELGPAAADELRSLITPQALGLMAAFLIAYVISQATPAGWIADVLAAVTVAVSIVLIGMQVLKLAEHLWGFGKAINATTEKDLRLAGADLARAIAIVGVGIVVALLTRSVGRNTARSFRPPSGPTASAPAYAVTNTGLIVQIEARAAAEAATSSRLVQAASMSMAVQPGGGGGGGGQEPPMAAEQREPAGPPAVRTNPERGATSTARGYRSLPPSSPAEVSRAPVGSRASMPPEQLDRGLLARIRQMQEQVQPGPADEAGRAYAISEASPQPGVVRRTRTVSGQTAQTARPVARVSLDRVLDHVDELERAGHIASGDAARMRMSGGTQLATHAEVQASIARPNQPIVVSRVMCSSCYTYFRAEARFRGVRQIVADPQTIRVFKPDGSIDEFSASGEPGAAFRY
jgi:Domain of unknown function (DUF4157)